MSSYSDTGGGVATQKKCACQQEAILKSLSVPMSNSTLKEQIIALSKQAQSDLEGTQELATLHSNYKRYLGKKGQITHILKGLKDLGAKERQECGQYANQERKKLEDLYKGLQARLEQATLEARLQKEHYDGLRPLPLHSGRLHPLTQMQYAVEDIFCAMGFQVMDGPEVESDSYNFERLNFTADHPARDMQDTIWTTEHLLLRTHTSAVQVRALEANRENLPLRMIAPGRCFRYEESDASHENTFHQVEGMLIDKDVSVAHLIHIMKSFLATIFERDVLVRLRPGYFPFVEPGFELDMKCLICQGKGCQTCKKSGWIEILPCGLVHPNVLHTSGIDPQKWSGFAFGLGLDRLVMMRYGVKDIRSFLSGNLRFLEQF